MTTQRQRAVALIQERDKFERGRETAPAGCAAFYDRNFNGLSLSLCCERKVCWGSGKDHTPTCEGCWNRVAVWQAPYEIQFPRMQWGSTWETAVRPVLELYEAHRQAGKAIPEAA